MISWIRPGWPDEARLISQLPTLLQLVRDFPFAGRCLNAGCGGGLYCPFLETMPEVTEIMNVDLSGTSHNLRHLTDRRHLSQDASLTALPFENASFDCCLCTEVLEHIPDDNQAVAEMARCLRPGGRVVVTVPHPPAPFDPNHVREGYTLPDLTELLNRHGIRVVKSARCFGKGLAVLLSMWRWQHRVLGRGQRNYMPRGFVRLVGYADRAFPIGAKWDLAIVGARE